MAAYFMYIYSKLYYLHEHEILQQVTNFYGSYFQDIIQLDVRMRFFKRENFR